MFFLILRFSSLKQAWKSSQKICLDLDRSSFLRPVQLFRKTYWHVLDRLGKPVQHVPNRSSFIPKHSDLSWTGPAYPRSVQLFKKPTVSPKPVQHMSDRSRILPDQSNLSDQSSLINFNFKKFETWLGLFSAWVYSDTLYTYPTLRLGTLGSNLS